MGRCTHRAATCKCGSSPQLDPALIKAAAHRPPARLRCAVPDVLFLRSASTPRASCACSIGPAIGRSKNQNRPWRSELPARLGLVAAAAGLTSRVPPWRPSCITAKVPRACPRCDSDRLLLPAWRALLSMSGCPRAPLRVPWQPDGPSPPASAHEARRRVPPAPPPPPPMRRGHTPFPPAFPAVACRKAHTAVPPLKCCQTRGMSGGWMKSSAPRERLPGHRPQQPPAEEAAPGCRGSCVVGPLACPQLHPSHALACLCTAEGRHGRCSKARCRKVAWAGSRRSCPASAGCAATSGASGSL